MQTKSSQVKPSRAQIQLYVDSSRIVHLLGQSQVLEVRDVRITDCAVRVKLGSSKQQLPEILTDWECWLEFEVRREK
jgi:acetolactate synthase regulatory subunit